MTSSDPEPEQARYRLYGNNGSPYSCKIRAYMRFKRIPFDWVLHRPNTAKFRALKPAVIPMLEFPDERVMNESTKMIKKLEAVQSEARHTHARRTVRPLHNRNLLFLCDLMEDFADEWMTKVMYGMRWNREADQRFSARWLILNSVAYNSPASSMMGAQTPKSKPKQKKPKSADTGAALVLDPLKVASMVAHRQIGRRDLVGCADDQYMHYTLHRTMAVFDAYLKRNWGRTQTQSQRSGGSQRSNIFLFGNRPSNADFAFYGQMRQFMVDPTPDRILRQQYPYVYAWLTVMDDLSGMQIEDNDDGWFSVQTILENGENGENGDGCAQLPSQGRYLCMQLLTICGSVYLPFLAANTDAFLAQDKRFSVKVGTDEHLHSQPTFRWQVKCLAYLRDLLKNTMDKNSNAENRELKAVLQQTGCWDVLIAGGNQNKSKL